MESLSIVRSVGKYRPLGSVHAPLWLAVVWASTDDTKRRTDIEEIIAEYNQDFPDANWLKIGTWLEARFKTLRRQRDQNIGLSDGVVGAEPDTRAAAAISEGAGPIHCCVM